MTPRQAQLILKQVNLTQTAAAVLFGVDISTVQRWCYRGINGPTAILLRLLGDGVVTMAQIAAARDKKRPRRN